MGLVEGRPARLRIELVYSPVAGSVQFVELTVAEDTSLLEALQLSGVLAGEHAARLAGLKVGIWGRVMPLDTVLRDRDRIEIYRRLTVDPKEARRLRYRSVSDKSKRVRPKPQR